MKHSKSTAHFLQQLVATVALSIASAAGQTIWMDYIRPKLPKPKIDDKNKPIGFL